MIFYSSLLDSKKYVLTATVCFLLNIKPYFEILNKVMLKKFHQKEPKHLTNC